MFYEIVGDRFLCRLERGEDVIEGLSELMRREELGCGAVTGLGAVDHARLGFYRFERQQYRDRVFDGEYELCGLTGTLSWHEEEPFPHVHLILVDDDFRTFGGHCFEARVSATVELFVIAFKEPEVDRLLHESIGLHLMDLTRHCTITPAE